MTAESGQLLSVQRGCYLPGNYQPGTALLLHSYRGWIWCKSSTQAWLLWTVEKCKHFRASSLFLLIKGKKQFPTVSEEGTILRFLFCLYLRFWGVVFLWFVFVVFFALVCFFGGFLFVWLGFFWCTVWRLRTPAEWASGCRMAGLGIGEGRTLPGKTLAPPLWSLQLPVRMQPVGSSDIFWWPREFSLKTEIKTKLMYLSPQVCFRVYELWPVLIPCFKSCSVWCKSIFKGSQQ